MEGIGQNPVTGCIARAEGIGYQGRKIPKHLTIYKLLLQLF